MTAPDPAVASGGLSDAAGESMSMVGGAIVNSFVSTVSMMAPVLIGAALICALVGLVVLVGKVRAEMASARRVSDPRPAINPALSDLLGDWL